MRIQPVYSNVYCNNNLQTKNKPSYNISCKSLESVLFTLVIREGIGALKSQNKKKFKYLYELQNSICGDRNEHFIAAVKAISKTPDSLYSYDKITFREELARDLSGFSSKLKHYLPGMRQIALGKLHKIPDSSYYNIQAKKDFVNSLFENGHEVNRDLVAQFSMMDSSLYNSFKEEAVSTCFYSTRYNQQRLNDDSRSFYSMTALPEDTNYGITWGGAMQPLYSQYLYEIDKEKSSITYKDKMRLVRQRLIAFDNLKLASTLDKDASKGFFARNRERINQHKQILENYFTRLLTETCGDVPQNTYNEYINILKPL